MLQENSGCILGDEMGLGKTLQIITLMVDYKQDGKLPMLVVAPVSLLQNWKRECEKFAPELRCCVHHGGQRSGRYKELEQYDVVIISYSIAVNDASTSATLPVMMSEPVKRSTNPISAPDDFIAISAAITALS